MPREELGHAACVRIWLERADGLDAAQLAAVFERALVLLWLRALQTLGEITLTAIVDRVLYTASERYPLLAPLKVEGTQIRFEEFRQQDWSPHSRQLREAVRFTLVEFLTVLGNLTADILTPALHAELSKVALANNTGKPGSRQASHAGKRHEREDAEP